jgi:hypothetical protein
MAKVNFPKATPEGTNDLSKGQNAPVSEAPLPSNLPLVFLLAEKGQTEPVLVEASKLIAEFGQNTFSETSAYFTHQTRLANIHMANANSLMVQRIVPAGAATARIRISVEVIPTELPVPFNVEMALNGSRLIWHIGTAPYVGGFKEFGQGNIVTPFRNGSVVDGGDNPLGQIRIGTDRIYTTSTLYPIMDIDVRSPGQHGNNTGISIQPVTEGIGSEEAHLAMKAFLYRMKFVSRARVNDPVVTRPSGLGNDYFDATFLPDVEFPRIRRRSYIEDVIGYEWAGSDYYQSSPFGAPHVYFDNMKTVLEKLQFGYDYNGYPIEGENAFDTDLPSTIDQRFALGDDANNAFLIDALTGYMFDGITPYRSFAVDSNGRFGGFNFNGNNVVYATGGADGLAIFADGRPNRLENMRLLDDGVRQYMGEFGTGKYKLLDMAMYPISTVYDTGFSYDTKIALLNAAQRRRDVAVILTPFIYGDYVEVDDGTGDPVINCTPSYAQMLHQYNFVLPVVTGDTVSFAWSADGSPVATVTFTMTGLPEDTYSIDDVLIRAFAEMGYVLHYSGGLPATFVFADVLTNSGDGQDFTVPVVQGGDGLLGSEPTPLALTLTPVTGTPAFDLITAVFGEAVTIDSCGINSAIGL